MHKLIMGYQFEILIKLSINNLCASKDTNCKTSTKTIIYMYEEIISIEMDTYIYRKSKI